ncbi:MAG: hypothetical protein ACR2HM_10750 [Acidimicrobiales bacterium]
MVSRWRLLVSVFAVAVSAAACGSTGIDEDAVGPAPATGKAADTARARTIVLEEADMPAGWRAVPHTETSLEAERSRTISACLGRPDPDTFRSARVYGPDLTLGRTQVSSIATVLNTVDDARADLAAIRGPKYAQCLVPAFRDDLRRQATDARVENVATEPLEVESFGDGSVGVRLTAELVYPDRTDRLFADLVYITKERSTVSATFFSFDEPFPTQLKESMVSRMGHRLAAS